MYNIIAMIGGNKMKKQTNIVASGLMLIDLLMLLLSRHTLNIFQYVAMAVIIPFILFLYLIGNNYHTFTIKNLVKVFLWNVIFMSMYNYIGSTDFISKSRVLDNTPGAFDNSFWITNLSMNHNFGTFLLALIVLYGLSLGSMLIFDYLMTE